MIKFFCSCVFLVSVYCSNLFANELEGHVYLIPKQLHDAGSDVPTSYEFSYSKDTFTVTKTCYFTESVELRSSKNISVEAVFPYTIVKNQIFYPKTTAVEEVDDNGGQWRKCWVGGTPDVIVNYEIQKNGDLKIMNPENSEDFGILVLKQPAPPAPAKSLVEGFVWEFSKYDINTQTQIIVQLDLRVKNLMIANVTCSSNGEISKPSTQAPVSYEGNKIINSQSSEKRLPFKGGYCFASIPAGRVMTYTVVDADHLLVSGDTFFPNNTLWTKITN